MDATKHEEQAPVPEGAESAAVEKTTSKRDTLTPGASSFRPKLYSATPVFSTSNLNRWLKHYQALGFAVARHGDIYGFASLGGVEIHVSVNPDHDPATTAGCAYLSVDDADRLHEVWKGVEGGRGPALVDTEYWIREGGHIDPDGNLMRYGSLMEGGE